MASIERTAYPRFDGIMSDRELRARYEVTDDEQGFIKTMANGEPSRLTLAVMLKTRQQLGYYSSLREVPDQIRAYLAEQCGFAAGTSLLEEALHKTSLHRHRAAVRVHLCSRGPLTIHVKTGHISA